MPMPRTTVSVWKVGAVAVTRVALGVGIGVLIADHIEPDRRKAVGGALLAVGALTTGPLVSSIAKGIEHPPPA